MGSRPPLPRVREIWVRFATPHPAELPGGEEAGEAVELGGLDARRPDAGVLVAEEDLAVVELDGANELLGRPEIRPGEPELQVAAAAPARLAAAAIVLETSGGGGSLRKLSRGSPEETVMEEDEDEGYVKLNGSSLELAMD
ncbi:hypothetical protein TIFTF001_005592 [Ficus carica]|uniref:Uncharacterized protein n=1 Tax=Ficus carica TaxID=3494 RepID=A0AA87ZFB7_FICCA|nr:hypothetical protein TIFTF001_005592 [Ficus carica]